jgi:cytochrome P450
MRQEMESQGSLAAEWLAENDANATVHKETGPSTNASFRSKPRPRLRERRQNSDGWMQLFDAFIHQQRIACLGRAVETLRHASLLGAADYEGTVFESVQSDQ